jgi:hypothetical protein
VALLTSPHGEYLAAVVADGAGSAVHSQVGSRIACDQIILQAASYLEEGRKLADLTKAEVLAWVETIVDVLQAEAAEASSRLREFACTLLVSIVGEEEAVFFQIGDGAMVVSGGPDDGWSYVFWPQHGEYANTTNFVVSPDLETVLEFEVSLRRVEEVALFSDGIENLVMHAASRSVHSPFFERMIRPVRRLGFEGESQALFAALQNYLSSPEICDRTDDDKTLILASRLRMSTDG